jgi:hypothetical protein
VFGPLQFYADGSEWSGDLPMEPNRRVELNVVADRQGPTPSQAELFAELRDRYRNLKAELHRLYFEEVIEHYPPPNGADDLWGQVVFDYVRIYDKGASPEITFAFSVPWDEEHGRYFELVNWETVGISM